MHMLCSNSSPSAAGTRTGTASETAKAYALRRSHSMMSDKAAAGVYCVHQTQTRCGALTMQTTTAPVSASRRAAATPTAATHEHHFSTKVAVQYWLQHVNDRITQDAQLVLTAVHEDACGDADVGDDDDVVVASSKMMQSDCAESVACLAHARYGRHVSR